MTRNKIIALLRKKNIRHYFMLLFCTSLSVLLVTAFSLMFFSPTVQTILPEGGDTGKQAVMIFIIAIAGCCMFTTYAASLFFRYKSREFGIFMALGERKTKLRKNLFQDLIFITVSCSAAGLLLSVPVSFFIWKLFQLFIVDTREMIYRIAPSGFICGILFCFFVTGCIFILASRFIKRSNIIEILQQQRKSETVREIKPWYGKAGFLLVVLGILLGYVLPLILANVFQLRAPFFLSALYLLSLWGVYMIMLSLVMKTGKEHNRKKYYKNIITVNMMRFSGRQTVKSMCIIAFLAGASLFAAFYVPMNSSSKLSHLNNNPFDYTFYYRATEDKMIEKEEIYRLADSHSAVINSYYEIKAIRLIADEIKRDYNDQNQYIELYHEKARYKDFFSQSDYNRISGQNISVTPGEYYCIISKDEREGFWNKWDDLSRITHPNTMAYLPIDFAGTAEFTPIAATQQTSYILSDEDYSRFSKDLPLEQYHNYVLFKVENPSETYEFAKSLKDEIVIRSSKESAVVPIYDEYAQMLAKEQGEVYGPETYPIELFPDNNLLSDNWKYYPIFQVLDKQDFLKNTAVLIMLFIYIAIVCFTAVGIIVYTRSLTIAIDNRALFQDLKKLGAKNNYIKAVLKKQLLKISMFPAILGGGAIYLFTIIIMYGNDNYISQAERSTLQTNFVLLLAAMVLMYGIYCLSLGKAKKTAGI